MKFLENKKTLGVILFFILTIITLYICFYKLGNSLLENWDEGFYAEVTKQMLKTNDLIVMRWNGEPLVDKPPLNFWLNYLSAKSLGLSEFSVRLTSAIAGAATILLVTYYSLSNWGIIAALFTFSAIALNNIFIWRTRTGNLDALASLLIFISFLIISGRHKYRYYLLGLIFGLLFLQKASLVAFPIFIFLIYEYFFNKNEILKNKKKIGVSILIFILIISIWLIPATLTQGILYLKYYLFQSDQGVSNISLFKIKPDYWLFTYYSLQRRLFFIFLIGLGFLLTNIKKGKEFLIFSFATFLLIMLSFTERNNNWYLVPSMPFWALTIGYGIYKIDQFLLCRDCPPFAKASEWQARFFLAMTKESQIKLMKKVRVIFWIFALSLLFFISYKTFTVNIAAIVNTRASESEVASARFIKKIAKPNDAIMRLDFSYPVTIYYSDLNTYYLDRIEPSLFETIKSRNISWVVGKKDIVNEFISKSSYQYMRYQVNDEVVLLLH